MGNEAIRTPQLDPLAADGVLFALAFVTSSVCSVSRTATLRGAYACSRGSGELAAIITPRGAGATCPAELRRVVYCIGSIGKWAVGAGEAVFRVGADLFDSRVVDRLHGNY